MEQPIWIESLARLPGILTVPDRGRASAGVVFVHGWAGYRAGPHRMFIHTAQALAGRGIASVRFDLRGRGASPEPDGVADLDGMVDDTLSAVRWLRAHNAAQRVFVLGICSGGNVALGAASLDKRIDGLILWSTPLFAPFKTKGQQARRHKLLLVEYARKLFRRETYIKLVKGKLNVGLVARVLFGRARQPAAGGRNPKDSLRAVMSDLVGFHGPALFIYGSHDDEAIGAPEFYGRYCRDHGIAATFHTIQGANHSYYSVAWEREVIGHTVDWLESLNAVV